MARMTVYLDGSTEANGAPLLMHNERMIDALDPFTRSVAEISKRRGKTDADELELSYREWLGCMYHDGLLSDPGHITEGTLGPFMPVFNIVRSIQNAGKQYKLGASVLRGVVPAQLNAPVLYDGPRDAESMWKDGRFALRKAVGVGQKRIMRTRPVFVDWRIEAEIEVDLTQINPEKINQLVADAGRYQALGDYRPVYGRFLGRAELVDPEAAALELEQREMVAA